MVLISSEVGLNDKSLLAGGARRKRRGESRDGGLTGFDPVHDCPDPVGDCLYPVVDCLYPVVDCPDRAGDWDGGTRD
jgi:hypothetical protein